MSRRRRLIGGTSPASISDLVAWYDTSSEAYLTLVGSAITQFLDRSGNGNHTDVQGTSTARPTWMAAQQNGLPLAAFDGGDSLAVNAALYSIPSGSNTAFIVALRTAETGAEDRLFTLAEAGSSRYRVEFMTTAGAIRFQSKASVGGELVSTGNTNTEMQIIRCRRNGVTQAISVNNGTEVTNANGANEADCNSGFIGTNGVASGAFLTGQIAEMIFYNRSLSQAEMGIVARYLSNKWGVALV